MALEAALAYAHLMAILSWVVFIASTTALAREEWFNAAALARLARVDRIAGIAAMAVLFTGAARVLWGVKGLHWYLGQPLLWLKVLLWLALTVVGVAASRRIQAWHRACLNDGALPPLGDLAALRRRVIGASHLLVVIPALAVCLARGIGTR